MATGVVKFYNHKAKFGFIRVNDSGAEIYTRKSRLIDPIDEGDKVEFDIVPGRKGDEAVNVRVVERASEKETPDA